MEGEFVRARGGWKPPQNGPIGNRPQVKQPAPHAFFPGLARGLLQCNFPVFINKFLIAFTAATLTALAQDIIQMTAGPVDNQVFQHNIDQTTDIRFSGIAAGKKVNDKSIEARVVGPESSALPGFDWTAVGKIVKLKWSGEIKHVPAGGPYR